MRAQDGRKVQSYLQEHVSVLFSVHRPQTSKQINQDLLGKNSPFSCQTTAKKNPILRAHRLFFIPFPVPISCSQPIPKLQELVFSIGFWFWFSHTLGILLHELPLVVKAGKPIMLLPCIALVVFSCCNDSTGPCNSLGWKGPRKSSRSNPWPWTRTPSTRAGC